MPLSCSSSVLTGVDGSIYFEPAGTQYCLLDNSDFPIGTSIGVPADNDYRVGDPVVFKAEGGGKLDTALTAGTTYYVVKRTATSIDVSAAKGGAAITLKGDGGLGAATGGVVTTITRVSALPTSTGSAPAGIATGITPASLPTTSGNFGAGPYVGVATKGGTGTGLTATVTVVASNVTAVAIASGGSGYTSADSITIDGALLGGTTTTDDITFTVNTVSAIKPGVYGPGPFTGIATKGGTGGGLTVDAIVANGEITGLTLNAGGTGYKTGESLTIDGALLGAITGTNDLVVTTGATSAIVAGGNTAGAANHISIDYADFAAVCMVKEFSIDLSREEIDTTTLPCGTGGGGSFQAPFRTMQAGYASGSGSMTVQFTEDQNTLANRLLSNSMRKNQAGAEVRLFVNAVNDGTGKPDLTKSLYIQAPISIMGFSLSVTPDDVITAELNFSLSGQPSHLLV